MNDFKSSLYPEKPNTNELNNQCNFEEIHHSKDNTRISPSIKTLGINRLANKFYENLIFSQNLNNRSPDLKSKLSINSEIEDQTPIESGFSIKSVEIIENKNNDNAKINNIKSLKINAFDTNKFANSNNLMSSMSPKSLESPKKINKSKLYKVISTFYLTKKFINSLINSSIYRKPKWFSAKNYSIINDNTYFLQKKENENLHCFNFLGEISICIFQPIQICNILWGFIIFILTCFYMIIIPINICFQIDFYKNILGDFQYLKLYVLVLFVINVFVVLNTAFYDKGELITSRVKILKNYLKNYLLIEFLSMFYLSIDFQSHFLLGRFETFLSILFFLRLKTNSDYLSRLEEFLFMDETIYNLFNLLKLILRILLIAHLFACIWHYIGISNNNEESWLDHYQISDDLLYYKYISSLYYVIIVMNTVGFGDVVPQNYTEKIFTIFFIFFACGLFAYTINSIGIILNNINKQNTQFQKIIQLMNGYLKRKKISMKLRIKIRKYIEYIYKEKQIQNDKEIEEIFGSLSKSLREEILLDANENILRSIPVFNNNFSEETLKRLVFELKEITVTPGDTLYLKDDNEEMAFYFIKNGEIELFAETKPITILKKLQKSQYFGELSFFSDKVHETSARSSKYSSLFMLKKENFLKVVKLNNDDYENYCQMKDKVNFYNQYEDLYLNCNFCNNNAHLSSNCPLVHLNLCPQRILLKYNYSEEQQRSKTIRNRIKALNSLKNYRKIKIKLIR